VGGTVCATHGGNPVLFDLRDQLRYSTQSTVADLRFPRFADVEKGAVSDGVSAIDGEVEGRGAR